MPPERKNREREYREYKKRKQSKPVRNAYGKAAHIYVHDARLN